MNLQSVIIEDDIHCSDYLIHLLNDENHLVDNKGVASNISDGVKLINKYNPDIVFLDIELTESSGFELFDFFAEPDFKVIFTTGFEEYALQALRLSALDYLVKPIDKVELEGAIDKMRKVKEKDISYKSLKKVLESQNKCISISTVDGYEVIFFDDIIRIEAQGNYSLFLTKNGNVLSTKSLKYFEEILSPTNRFIRVNKKDILQKMMIKKIIRGRYPIIVLRNGEKIKTSDRRRKSLLQFALAYN